MTQTSSKVDQNSDYTSLRGHYKVDRHGVIYWYKDSVGYIRGDKALQESDTADHYRAKRAAAIENGGVEEWYGNQVRVMSLAWVSHVQDGGPRERRIGDRK